MLENHTTKRVIKPVYGTCHKALLTYNIYDSCMYNEGRPMYGS